MPVCEQEYEDGVLQQTRVNLLGARGIEAVVAIDHTRGNPVRLDWLLYDGHGNLVRLMAPDYTLSAFQWRGVWGEVQGSLGAGRGYCANLGHPEDETGLVYMRARYYEPATGRFISEDPARDGVNWYLYADGNPVNKVDAKGTEAKRTLFIISSLVAILGLLKDPIIDAFFNPALANMLVGWLIGIGLHIFMLPLYGVSWQVGLAWGSITLTLGTEWALIYGLVTIGDMAQSALENSTLQGQIKEFWKGYASLLLASILILGMEVSLATGYF
jgi:RHS repeat-associated protein